jgi:CRISPR-associated protein Cas2
VSVYLVCYDISDDGLRDQVSRVLEEHGNRVQRSVFEVALRGEPDRARLERRLREVLGETPELRFYRLCERCRGESFDLNGERIAVFPRTVIL